VDSGEGRRVRVVIEVSDGCSSGRDRTAGTADLIRPGVRTYEAVGVPPCFYALCVRVRLGLVQFTCPPLADRQSDHLARFAVEGTPSSFRTYRRRDRLARSAGLRP
jgi:hypothetical protein